MKTEIKIGLAVAALSFAVPVGCSLIGGAASVATAPGRVVSKTMQTDNIIGNYEAFFNRKAQYDTRIAQIGTQVVAVADNEDPAEASRLRVELAAMRQSCRTLAAQYNADSAKLNRSVFKSNDLPATLSESACNE